MTSEIQIEKARPPAWELQATPGQWGTRRRSSRLRGTPAPGLQRRLQRPIRQNIRGKYNKGEYLAYPRVLRPLLSIMHIFNGKKRLYIVDCKIEIRARVRN